MSYPGLVYTAKSMRGYMRILALYSGYNSEIGPLTYEQHLIERAYVALHDLRMVLALLEDEYTIHELAELPL